MSLKLLLYHGPEVHIILEIECEVELELEIRKFELKLNVK